MNDLLNTGTDSPDTLTRTGAAEYAKQNFAPAIIEIDEKAYNEMMLERDSQGKDYTTYTRLPDRDAGARKRCDAILAKHPELVVYYQGDPRGASLYIVRRSDLNGSDINSTYTRGVAIYK